MRRRCREPKAISYDATLSVREKSGQWEGAPALLQETWPWGLEPNLISHNATISAGTKGSSVEIPPLHTSVEIPRPWPATQCQATYVTKRVQP